MARNFLWRKGGSRKGQPGFLISFEFDPVVIMRIKETVPPAQREWRPEDKEWWISEDYEKELDVLSPGFSEAVAGTKPLF